LRAAVLDIDRFRPVEHLTDLPLTTSEDDADWRAMTNTQVPVLMASLVALGACSYEVSIGGGGGGGGAFDATKIADIVKQVARGNLGEPSAVRCPPKMQFIPRDRYTCQFDFEGATYDVAIRHGVWMNARARMPEPAMGYEALAKQLEAYYEEEKFDVDCSGVVVSRAKPTGFCPIDGNHGVIVRMVDDEVKVNTVSWKGNGLPW
jgi:hypothetical protein